VGLYLITTYISRRLGMGLRKVRGRCREKRAYASVSVALNVSTIGPGVPSQVFVMVLKGFDYAAAAWN